MNSFGADTRMFHADYVNTMAADALAPCVARASAATVLTLYDKLVLAFHEEGFQLPAHSLCQEMIKNVIIFLCFQQNSLHYKG